MPQGGGGEGGEGEPPGHSAGGVWGVGSRLEPLPPSASGLSRDRTPAPGSPPSSPLIKIHETLFIYSWRLGAAQATPL